MKNKKLIIYGVGNFAEFICDSFMNDSAYTVVAQCVEGDYLSKANKIKHKYPLVDFDVLENNFDPSEYDLFITVGNDWIRERIYKEAKEKGYLLANYIATNAICPKNLKIGDNVYIGEGTLIQAFTEINNNTIIIAAKIGHHSKIGKNSLLSACIVGAEVSIGDNSFLGLNATIKPRTKIGMKNIIGMNCNIISDTADKSVFNQPGTTKRGLTYDNLKSKYL
jgi:acetyltransferase-like isoleucine patch superfamily enzyme